MEASIEFSDRLQWNPKMQGIHGTVFALKRLILMPSSAGLFIGRLVKGLIEGHASCRDPRVVWRFAGTTETQYCP